MDPTGGLPRGTVGPCRSARSDRESPAGGERGWTDHAHPHRHPESLPRLDGRVLLSGNVEFQGRAARMATCLGIRVTNPELQGIVREAQQPYDHRAWAAASQRVREEREQERREAAPQVRQRRAGAAPPPPNNSPTTEQPAPRPRRVTFHRRAGRRRIVRTRAARRLAAAGSRRGGNSRLSARMS